MKDTQPVTVDLEADKIAFLELMARTHGLPDLGKTVRCLIDYARAHPDAHTDIFEEIRCHDC